MSLDKLQGYSEAKEREIQERSECNAKSILLSDAEVIAELKRYITEEDAKYISLKEMTEKKDSPYYMWLPAYNNHLIHGLVRIVGDFNNKQPISLSNFLQAEKTAEKLAVEDEKILESNTCSSTNHLIHGLSNLRNLFNPLPMLLIYSYDEPSQKGIQEKLEVLKGAVSETETNVAIIKLFSPDSEKSFAASVNKNIFFNDDQIRFLREFYKEVTDVRKGSEVSGDQKNALDIRVNYQFTIKTDCSAKEYQKRLKFLKEWRNAEGLVPLPQNKETIEGAIHIKGAPLVNVMDFKQGKDELTISFINVSQKLFKGDYDVAIKFNKELKNQQQAQVIGR
jgi:hypothetical protein